MNKLNDFMMNKLQMNKFHIIVKRMLSLEECLLDKT